MTHSVCLSDGAADISFVWSPDSCKIMAQADGDPIVLEVSRDDLFGLAQFVGTVMNQIHFGEPGSDGGE